MAVLSGTYREANHGLDLSLNKLDRLVVGLHHGGKTGAIDIGIQDAYLSPLLLKRKGKIDSSRGFAHPTLAAGYSYHIGHTG